MQKSGILTLAAFILAVLGIIMIVLGTKANILPPTITGVGFIIIAVVFWKLRS